MEQKKEAIYLINDERYLHLRENGAGVGFATYNKVTGEPLESGQISEKNLPPDGRNMMSAARNWYLFELSDDDRKAIQLESVKILETIPQAGIGRRRIWEPETIPPDIRLINSYVRFEKEQLLEYKKWSTLSKQYINRIENSISLISCVSEYSEILRLYYYTLVKMLEEWHKEDLSLLKHYKDSYGLKINIVQTKLPQ